MKFVGKGAVPISNDSGLLKIKMIAQNQQFDEVSQKGTLKSQSILDDYVAHLLGYIEPSTIKPLKIVVNSGNGAAGHVIDALEKQFQLKNIPITFIKVNHEPNGNFPRGIPNPLLPECREDTIDAVKKHQADFGVAWDGDFDRCFLFDHQGGFIEGYYIVGLLAQAILTKHPNEKIIYDPRLTWNTIDVVTEAGGTAIQSKTGHAFIKERMRAEDAIYGGEMSAHHYFRDFAYCDSGMIPWLMIAQLLSITNQTLKSLVEERMEIFPCSGEINFKVADVNGVLKHIESEFLPSAINIEKIDGISMDMGDWRFNLRGSNTEPLLRLNIETNANENLLSEKVQQLSGIINAV